MAINPDQRICGKEGDVVLPRRNGEPLFGALQESRTFGITLALKDSGLCGLYRWEGLRGCLITEIALTTRWQHRPTLRNDWPLWKI